MHRRVVVAFLLLASVASPLAAQAKRDQARLVIGIFGGYMLSSDLWNVSGQPLVDDNAGDPLIDTLRIGRRIRTNPTFGARVAYFRNDHVGYYGEAFLLGLGYEDACSRSYATTSQRNADVCETINTSESPASAVQLGAGLIYRVASQEIISPFIRAGVGIGLSNRSSTGMTGSFRSPASDNQLVQLDVYLPGKRTQLHPALTLGAGFTSQVGRGYLIRWEIQDNIVGVNSVTGPTVIEGLEPETSMRFRHRFSITAGFDVMLERRPGRRY